MILTFNKVNAETLIEKVQKFAFDNFDTECDYYIVGDLTDNIIGHHDYVAIRHRDHGMDKKRTYMSFRNMYIGKAMLDVKRPLEFNYNLQKLRSLNRKLTFRKLNLIKEKRPAVFLDLNLFSEL